MSNYSLILVLLTLREARLFLLKFIYGCEGREISGEYLGGLSREKISKETRTNRSQRTVFKGEQDIGKSDFSSVPLDCYWITMA